MVIPTAHFKLVLILIFPEREISGLTGMCRMQARAGYTSTAEVVRIAESYRNEENYTVWSSVLINLAGVGTLLQERRGPAAELDALDRFVCDLVEPIASKLGWVPPPNESTDFLLLDSRSNKYFCLDTLDYCCKCWINLFPKIFHCLKF